MPSLVYDFKDIASRMKGELKQEPTPKEEPMPRFATRSWADMSAQPICTLCDGCGVDLFRGGSVCKRCFGRGIVP